MNLYDPATAGQMALFGADDRAYERQAKRSRETKRAIRKIEQSPPPLPDGPCCGRCRAFEPATDGRGFGQCLFLSVNSTRSREYEKGCVVDWTANVEASEQLNIKPWADGCSAFVAANGKQAA